MFGGINQRTFLIVGDLLNLNSFELLHVSPAILLDGFITAVLNMVRRWHYRFQLFSLARSTAVMRGHENAIEQIFGYLDLPKGVQWFLKGANLPSLRV